MLKKQVRLTNEQKEKIYKLYDQNMSQQGQPDYEGIVTALMRETPPIVITKEAICYQIKQRKKRAKAAVIQAKQQLESAKGENFAASGEQGDELPFDEIKETDPISIKNSVVMLKYYAAKKAKAEYEKVIGNYVHIDELTIEFKKIYDLISRELDTLKRTLLSEIIEKIRLEKYHEAQETIDRKTALVQSAVKKAIIDV